MSSKTLAGQIWEFCAYELTGEGEARPFSGAAARAALRCRLSSASVNGRRLPGRGGEDGRGPLQDLDIFAEPAVFAAQLRQFPPLRGGDPTAIPGRSVRLGLFDLRLVRRLSRVNVARHLAGRAVFPPTQLNDLDCELPGERTAAPRHV